MLTELRLRNFKNFEDATLALGPFTVIAGANASGKSNLRDAFRFLHGVGRGYSVAEIIGERWSAGGVMEWAGMRGGIKEMAFHGRQQFQLDAEVSVLGSKAQTAVYLYHLDISLRAVDHTPRVLEETLFENERRLFWTQKTEGAAELKLGYTFEPPEDAMTQWVRFPNSKPMLLQAASNAKLDRVGGRRSQPVIDAFSSCRFLDLSPTAMRLPSIPGQVVLGDRGDNLSSVLQAICADEAKKAALLDWVRQLTPMDAVDFDFAGDQTGRVLLTLVEADGQRTSAYSASDGTLRLLAILAALLGPEPARFYFFEELENGIHPNRLALLAQLLESVTDQGKTQIVATTHSPQLLRLLSRQTLEHAAVVYRLPGTTAGRIKRMVDIPHIREVLETQDVARLHESGWLEDILSFSEAPEPVETPVEA